MPRLTSFTPNFHRMKVPMRNTSARLLPNTTRYLMRSRHFLRVSMGNATRFSAKLGTYARFRLVGRKGRRGVHFLGARRLGYPAELGRRLCAERRLQRRRRSLDV